MISEHSDLIREKIVVWVSVSATAFLTHFAVLNSFLENCSTFCMIFWYSLRFYFLMILFFLSHAWMYSVQSLMIQQLLLIHCMLLMIFVHFFIHSALIISCDLAQKVKISMIFFNASSSCLMYSSMHQHLISWFNNDFNICSFKVLMNFSSFIVFQLQHDFCADSLQTLKSIIVCINKWFEKFFISSLILHCIIIVIVIVIVIHTLLWHRFRLNSWETLCYLYRVNKTLWERKSLVVYTAASRSRNNEIDTVLSSNESIASIQRVTLK